jgi:hypothetical protein
MWWIALAVTAQPVPDRPRPSADIHVMRQADAMVRIARPAIVKLGRDAAVIGERTIPATDAAFRDADGRERPARLVEFR